MIWSEAVLTPAANKAANPVIRRVKLTKCVIHTAAFFWPPGSMGQTHAIVQRGLHQVWPRDPHTTISTTVMPLVFKEHYELKAAPYEFVVKTWNVAAAHQHTFYMFLGGLPRDQLIEVGTLQGELRLIRRQLEAIRRGFIGV